MEENSPVTTANRSSNVESYSERVADNKTPKIDYRKFYEYKQTERDNIKTEIAIILQMIRLIKDKKRPKLSKQSAEELGTEMDELETAVLKQLTKYVEVDNKLTAAEKENLELKIELKDLKEREISSDEHINKKNDNNTIRQKTQDKKNRDLYSIVIESLTDNQEDIRDLVRKEMKSSGKKINIGDIALTKTNKLIFKAEEREDLENVRKWISGNKTLEEKIKCSNPTRKTERIMLLGIAPDTEAETITEDLRDLVENNNPNIAPYKPLRRKDGLLNWMIDVDCDTKRELLTRQRICVDMMRIRVVEYIRIWRCFNCQGLGHISTKCKNKVKCGKCSQEHNTRDCNSEHEKCANCTVEQNHRSDSYSCPAFIKYKRDLISKRL